jgi:hypothetical protein
VDPGNVKQLEMEVQDHKVISTNVFSIVWEYFFADALYTLGREWLALGIPQQG